MKAHCNSHQLTKRSFIQSVRLWRSRWDLFLSLRKGCFRVIFKIVCQSPRHSLCYPSVLLHAALIPTTPRLTFPASALIRKHFIFAVIFIIIIFRTVSYLPGSSQYIRHCTPQQLQVSNSKMTAIQTFHKCTLGIRALTAVKLAEVTVCGHALNLLCVSFKHWACL